MTTTALDICPACGAPLPVTPGEAARRIGVSRHTVHAMVHRGQIRVDRTIHSQGRFGMTYLLNPDDVAEAAKQRGRS